MMTNRVIRGGLRTTLAFANILATTAAFAQSAPTTTATANTAAPAAAASGTSVSTSAPGEKLWIEKLKITYSATIDGPPISALDSNFRSSSSTGYQSEDAPVGVRNDLLVLYPINDKVMFGPVFKFQFRAVPSGKNTNALNDPYIRLATSSLYGEGNLKAPSQLRLGLPWSDASQTAGRRLYLLARTIPTYAIPDSKFEISLDAIALSHFYHRRHAQGKPQTDFEMYATPGVGYQLLPTLALSVGYNMGATHELGQPFSEFNNDGTSLQPGLSWDISPSFNVSPSIYIFTGNRVAPDTTVTEVGVTWKIM